MSSLMSRPTFEAELPNAARPLCGDSSADAEGDP